MARNETALIIRLRADQAKLKQDMARVRATMNRHKSQMQGIGRQMSSTLAGYFGGYQVIQGISMAVRSLAGFEKGMSKVRAISGASNDQFEDLRNNALELGRATKFTATEIAQLQVELSKLGFTPDKILASTDAIRKLATVADSELGAAASTMAGTLNSFNLEATESERVANVMAESFSKSALDMEKFTVATANSGAIANVLGTTLEENTARIGALVDANIDASKAGTDLRMIYLRLNEEGLTFNQAMELIRQSSDKAGLAQELFGTRAAGAAVILSNQSKKVNELTKELTDSNRELDNMASIMEDNLSTAWDKFTSAIDGAIQKQGALTGFFKSIVDGATLAVNALFGNLPSYDEELIAKFTEQGQKIADSFGESEKAIEDINTTLDFYEKRLDSAKKKLQVFTEANVVNGVVTAANASEYRDLRDEVIKYDSILNPIKTKLDNTTASMEVQTEAAKKLKEELGELANWQNYKSRTGGMSDLLGDPMENLSDPISSVEMPDPLHPEMWEESADRIEARIRLMHRITKEEMQGLADSIDDIIKTQITSAFIGLGEVIGNAIGGGGAGFEDLFGVILGTITDGMKAVGGAMIAFGVAQSTFIAGLSSLNPALLIGGGVALIAAASAVQSAFGSTASSLGGGASGGGSSAPSGNFRYDRTEQSIDVNVTGSFDGSNIVLAYDTIKSRENRLNG